MTDKEFLTWIRDRIVNVYEESPNVDFVRRLEEVIDNLDKIEKASTQLVEYSLVPSLFQGTLELMAAGGQLNEICFPPRYGDPARVFRRELLESEYREYTDDGEELNDPIEVADGLLDIIVVAWGSLLSYFGPDKARAMADEVTRSNLDKINGKHGPTIKRGDGKILKPEGWVGPQLRKIIEGNVGGI